MLKQNYSEAEQ